MNWSLSDWTSLLRALMMLRLKAFLVTLTVSRPDLPFSNAAGATKAGFKKRAAVSSCSG